LTTSGTASNPITFQAEPDAIVDTQNPITPDGINLEGASYVVIEGFTVTGVPRAGIRAVLNHHVVIRGNIGDSNGRWGILTGFSDHLLIEHNVMSRSLAEHGIYVGNSGDRPVIRGNVVWGNHANGIHMNGDVSQGGDGIITGALGEAKTIYDNGLGGGSGINCDGVQSSVFRNNLLYGNPAGGISLYRIDGAQPARNNQILHNTIVQASDGRWAINIQNASTGNVVRNNILYNQHPCRGRTAASADSLPGFVSDTNVIMDRFSRDGGDTRIALSAWRTATGQDLHSCIATYTGGTGVILTAAPASGWVFAGWSGGGCAGTGSCALTLMTATTVRATFAPAPVALTVVRAGLGSGSVTSAPAGIACGTTC